MRNAYIAAAKSYLYRLACPTALTWVILALVIDAFVLSMGLRRGHPQAAGPSIMAMFGMVALVCVHARQFAVEAKLRCLPRGTTAHVGLLAIILLFLAVIHIFLLTHYDLGPFSAILALVFAACAVAACVSLRGLWFVLAAFCFLPLIQDSHLASKAWNLLTDVHHPEIPWVIAIAAILWLILEFRRLAHLDEDSWGYTPLNSRLESQLAPRSTMEASDSYNNRVYFNRLTVCVPSSRMIVHAIARGRSSFLLIRAQRWQVMMPPSAIVFMTLLMTLPQALILKFGTMPRTAPPQYMPYQMVFTILAMMTLAGLGQQRRYLTTAILRPISRETYFREIGTGMAITFARNLGITVFITIPILWLVNGGHLDLTALAQLTLADILLAIFAFGWSLWCLRFDTSSIVTTIPGMIPFMAVIPFWSGIYFDTYRPHVIAACLLLALLGLYLTRDAYRRWLITDLG